MFTHRKKGCLGFHPGGPRPFPRARPPASLAQRGRWSPSSGHGGPGCGLDGHGGDPPPAFLHGPQVHGQPGKFGGMFWDGTRAWNV